MAAKRLVFQGLHFRVYHQDVELQPGTFRTFEYIWRRDGTRIIAIRDNREILLNREYRHELDAYDWKLPGGKLDDENEPPDVAARRELREETGYEAQDVSFLATTIPFATIHYRIHFFLTFDPEPGTKNLDAGEQLTSKWTPLDDVLTMIHRNRLREEISALTLLRLKHGDFASSFKWST